MDLKTNISFGRKKTDEALNPRVVHNEQPVLPRVNLLPKKVRVSIKIARIRKVAMGAALAVLLTSGLFWYSQGSTIAQAEQGVSDATEVNQDLQVQVNALAPIGQLYAQLTNQQEFVESALASSPTGSAILTAFESAAASVSGKPLELNAISIVFNPIPEVGTELNACPNPDPFGTEISIGCITFTGTAPNRDAISQFLLELEADPLFIGPYINTSSVTVPGEGQKSQVSFSGTTAVSLGGLETPVTQELIDALLQPETETDPDTTDTQSPGTEVNPE